MEQRQSGLWVAEEARTLLTPLIDSVQAFNVLVALMLEGGPVDLGSVVRDLVAVSVGLVQLLSVKPQTSALKIPQRGGQNRISRNVRKVGRMPHDLLRNAADVDAGSAEPPSLFDDRDLPGTGNVSYGAAVATSAQISVPVSVPSTARAAHEGEGK